MEKSKRSEKNLMTCVISLKILQVGSTVYLLKEAIMIRTK